MMQVFQTTSQQKPWNCNPEYKNKKQTSTRATNEAAIIAKASPASKDGAPHWKGYGTLILFTMCCTKTMNSNN